jgi:hypothetical protein
MIRIGKHNVEFVVYIAGVVLLALFLLPPQDGNSTAVAIRRCGSWLATSIESYRSISEEEVG